MELILNLGIEPEDLEKMIESAMARAVEKALSRPKIFEHSDDDNWVTIAKAALQTDQPERTVRGHVRAAFARDEGDEENNGNGLKPAVRRVKRKERYRYRLHLPLYERWLKCGPLEGPGGKK